MLSELWLPHVACFLDYGLLFLIMLMLLWLVVVVMVVILLLLLSLAAVAGHNDCQRPRGIGVDVRFVRLERTNWSRCLSTGRGCDRSYPIPIL